MNIGKPFMAGEDGDMAETDRRRWAFPNGRFVYESEDGTYSHQPPNDNWDCGGHATIAEAVGCFAAQCAALDMGEPASAVRLLQHDK